MFVNIVAPTPAPATSIFGAPAPAAGGLFGAPGKRDYVMCLTLKLSMHFVSKIHSLIHTTPNIAPAPTGGLFGAPAPAAPAFGSPAPSAFGGEHIINLMFHFHIPANTQV